MGGELVRNWGHRRFFQMKKVVEILVNQILGGPKIEGRYIYNF
jgi:hypothetical protein